MLCIWWDQLGVVYYEVLKPTEIITGDRYRMQLMPSIERQTAAIQQETR